MLKYLLICMFLFNAININAQESRKNMKEKSIHEKQTIEKRFAKYGEERVHYLNKGKGKDVIIFVHGWACNSKLWRAQIDSFPESRVIVIDLPGHGESDKPRVDYTIDYFAKSIEAVMKDAGVSHAVLVGHSLGAAIIRHFYRLYPDEVSGLVNVDGIIQQGFYNKLTKNAFQQGENLKAKIQETVDYILIPVKDESLRKELRELLLSTPDYVAAGSFNSVMDEKIFQEDLIQVPTLVILLKKPLWPANIEQSLRTFVPNLVFTMWEGVSHFLMLEKPEDFNRVLNEFLSKSDINSRK